MACHLPLFCHLEGPLSAQVNSPLMIYIIHFVNSCATQGVELWQYSCIIGCNSCFGLNCRYCCYIISASLTSANFSVVTPAQLQCLCSGKEKPGKEAVERPGNAAKFSILQTASSAGCWKQGYQNIYMSLKWFRLLDVQSWFPKSHELYTS